MAAGDRKLQVAVAAQGPSALPSHGVPYMFSWIWWCCSRHTSSLSMGCIQPKGEQEQNKVTCTSSLSLTKKSHKFYSIRKRLLIWWSKTKPVLHKSKFLSVECTFSIIEEQFSTSLLIIVPQYVFLKFSYTQISFITIFYKFRSFNVQYDLLLQVFIFCHN